MITGLDHIVLICPDIESGTACYSTLLGRTPDWRASASGAATAMYQMQNTAIELMAPQGDGAVAGRLGTLLQEAGPRLTSLAFATDDIDAAHHRLARRGLKPGDMIDGTSTDQQTGTTRSWRRLRCSDSETAGVKTFVLETETPLPYREGAPGAVTALDHIVVETPNPDRALALYGGRLGLDLRLDRTAEQWRTRFLFFRTGGLTLEIVHGLGAAHDPDEPDCLWGLTWAVDDLAAAHSRLRQAGLALSEIRQGRKPGSSVFTVRDGTLGVPTLFIAHAPR